MTESELDQRLLAAHAENDKATLVKLYEQAAETAISETARYFYLTHAYVYALDIGDPAAAALREQLRLAGRET